ncbi:STAS domain-containing protein [Asaia bogorensis]|uniref:STAS domain-containing protein n=1 Tax=Asaia bogorensis TaxID=91915 RepID=UPI000EFC3BC8|nr:STAS domain-containing protein [Asaia bogorensis]
MSVIPVPPETMPHQIMLPPRLDTKAAAALRDDLMVDDDTPVDGSAVTYLGGLCLQILLAGKREIINPSEKLAEALALFGVPFLLREPRTTSSET